MHWTEEQFWRSSPRLLFALLDVHSRINSAPDKTDKEERQAKRVDYYDDLPPGFW